MLERQIECWVRTSWLPLWGESLEGLASPVSSGILEGPVLALSSCVSGVGHSWQISSQVNGHHSDHSGMVFPPLLHFLLLDLEIIKYYTVIHRHWWACLFTVVWTFLLIIWKTLISIVKKKYGGSLQRSFRSILGCSVVLTTPWWAVTEASFLPSFVPVVSGLCAAAEWAG